MSLISMKNMRVLLSIFFFLSSAEMVALYKVDTLSLAKKHFDKGEYTKAEKLLKPYCEKHEEELNAQWLYAQTAYFTKHFKTADKVYENALLRNPDNYYLMLDYAQKLANMGELEKAIPLLKKYLTYDSIAPDAHSTLEKIALWRGDYKTALKENDKVRAAQKDNKDVIARRTEILQAKSPWIGLNVGYTNDNQPLQYVSSSLETGIWLHRLVNLRFAINAPLYIRDSKLYNAQQFTVGNKFSLTKIGLQIYTEGGFIRLPNNKIAGIGLLELKQTVLNHLEISALAGHKAYIYTRMNMDNPLMYMHYNFSAGWNNLNSFQVKASFDGNQFYTDNNFVYNIGAWLLSPPLKTSVVDFRIGYSYSYSNSIQNRYTNEKTLNDILQNWESDSSISGIYNPYFTPNKQNIHSAILTIGIRPTSKIHIGLRGNIGFSATTKHPSLYLDINEEGDTYIARNFYSQSFFPAEANAYIAAQLNSKVFMKAEYTFMNTVFYSSHYAGLSLKISFWNGKNE